MKASLQPLGWLGLTHFGLLRIHESDNGNWERRDPFTWSAVLAIRGRTAEVLGADKEPLFSEARAIHRFCKNEAGILVAHWERANVENPRIVTVTR